MAMRSHTGILEKDKMKLKTILFIALLMMSLAVGASAQTDDDDDDMSGGALAVLLLAIAESSGSNRVPVYDVTAGQPIRVRAGDVNRDGIDDLIVGTGVQGHVKSTQVPCTDARSTAVRKAGDDKRQDYLTVTLEETMISATQRSWRNTCRLLTVESKTGKKYVAKLRFR